MIVPNEGRRAMKRDHEKSSGNVFADLGFRNPKQELLKAKLTIEIYRLLKARGITQQESRAAARYHPAASVRAHALQAGVSFGGPADGVPYDPRAGCPGHRQTDVTAPQGG
jgi:hypothetical protein